MPPRSIPLRPPPFRAGDRVRYAPGEGPPETVLDCYLFDDGWHWPDWRVVSLTPGTKEFVKITVSSFSCRRLSRRRSELYGEHAR
jgi:hypothetical protein